MSESNASTRKRYAARADPHEQGTPLWLWVVIGRDKEKADAAGDEKWHVLVIR